MRQQRITVTLDAAGTRQVLISPLASYAVCYYDGDENAVYLQKTKQRDDPDAIALDHFAGETWPSEDWWDTAWIVNTKDQAGKRLVLKVAGPGYVITPGQVSANASPTPGSATAENQSTIIDLLQGTLVADGALDYLQAILAAGANHDILTLGRKEPPTVSAERIAASSTPVLDGCSIALLADDNNTVPVYIGTAAGITTATGFPLAPGARENLRLKNVYSIYCIAAASGQLLHWAIEEDS